MGPGPARHNTCATSSGLSARAVCAQKDTLHLGNVLCRFKFHTRSKRTLFPGAHVKNVKYFFSGSRPLSITIPEYTSKDVPLVFRIQRKACLEDPGPLDIHVLHTYFYRPALRNIYGPKPPLTIDDLIDNVKNATYMPQTFRGESSYPILLRSEYREVDMGEDKQIEKIREYFAGFILIDGVIFKPTTEPRYLIQRSFWNNEHTTWLSVVPTYERHWNTDLSCFFNANQKKEAMTLLNNLVQHSCKNNPADNHNIEVFLPGAVLLDPRGGEQTEKLEKNLAEIKHIDERLKKMTHEAEGLQRKRAELVGKIA